MVILQLEEQPPLIQAVFAGDADVVRNLLQNKEDVNYQDYEKRCALHAAAFKGDAVIAKLLLEHGARVNTKDCKWLTPLHRACCTGSEETVSVLLNNSADTSARDRLWQTPLHIAAAFNALECLSYLLDKIPNLNVTDRSGRIALHHAVLNGHNDVVELLISKGCIINACDKKDCRPIHWAAHMGHTDTIELLLRNGADINARDRNQYTPLHVAAASGMVGACRILIAYGAHLEAQNAYGNTSLHSACLNGHLPVCEELVANGADKEAQNYRGQTPLHIAAASTHGVHCLNFLVANNVNINRQSIDGRTPLHMTAIHGRFTRSKTLIDKGAIVDCLDKNSCTALHIAAQHGHELLSNTLLSYGANASRRGYEGRTPLHMCCLSGYVECCRAFIKAGVDINCQDDTGKTPTHCAAYKGSVECLDLLVSSGANFKMVDLIGRTPLHYSAAQGYFFCVFTLVGIGSSVNQVDAEGCAPLHLAAAYDLEGRCIDYLIQHKANPKMKDSNGFTPVHYAVAGSNAVGLKYLLDAVGTTYLLYGPDMPPTTPLHIAAKNGNMDILEKLMPYFPDPNIRNEYGCTPLLLAAREGFANCVQFLLRFGAKVSICDSINRLSSVHHSAKNGHVHCLALLVDNAEDKSIIDMPDELQRTALMLAVSGSHDDCVTTLIKSGADPNVLDGNAHSCLFRAVVTGQHNILQLLLPRSSVVNNPDVNGKTVLHVAAACGRLACIQRILPYMDREVAAGGDNEKFTALHWACYSGSSDCVGHFLKEGVYKTLNGNLFSAVHCATSAGSEKCLELLCSHYGPEIVQLRDSRMRTPLHIAALHGHTECTKYLLEQGAEIDCKDEDGRSPLVAASQNGQVQVIEILISYKADVTLYDTNGNTALHLACLRKHNLAALLLLEFIDDPDIINMINNDRRTPLHLSARNGLVDVTRQLIMKGSSVTAVDANGLTPALSCAPNPSVAQCLAIILASHPDQGLLRGNNGKELIQNGFPMIDSQSSLDKLRSQKSNVTQTEITLMKNPDQFELEQIFEVKFSHMDRSREEDSLIPTIMHPYLAANELKLRKKKKPPPVSKSKDDDCFIIESYEDDDKSLDKFFGLGRDLHKSQSDMTLTTKTIYSEEDYGRIIQSTRPKSVDDIERRRLKLPIRKEPERNKVRLRLNNSKSEEDRRFFRRPGAKMAEEEVHFRKVDGFQEHIDVTHGLSIDSDNPSEQHKRCKLDETKMKLPRPTVKKMKVKKVDEDNCNVCKLVTQRVVDSDFKPERIKHYSATLDRAKEDLIASKNNNRCLRAFLDQSYDLNDANKTAIYHGMLQPRCEPYIAKLLNLPAFRTSETPKMTDKDKSKITKVKFMKPKITKPKVKSEETLKKHEDSKITQPRATTKTIEAIKIKDLKKRKVKEKQTKHKTVADCASENALQPPKNLVKLLLANDDKSPEETTMVYCRPGFIDEHMRNQVKATVSDVQKDMSVSTYIDGCMIENCGENTFKVTGDVLKKQIADPMDAELKQTNEIMDLSNKNFPEYLKTLTSFHLNPMFINEAGKSRCYPTYWCFPELDDNEGPDEAVSCKPSVKPRDKSYSDSGLLSKNGGECSGISKPIANASAQTNIVCVRSEASVKSRLFANKSKENDNTVQKDESKSENLSESNSKKQKTIDEKSISPNKNYFTSNSFVVSSTSKESGYCNEENFWQEIDLNSTSNDDSKPNHNVLYFNDKMDDESTINISDKSSKYSKEFDSEMTTTNSKMQMLNESDPNTSKCDISIIHDDEDATLDNNESNATISTNLCDELHEEFGDSSQVKPNSNSVKDVALSKSSESDYNKHKMGEIIEQNAAKEETANRCDSKACSLNNNTKKQSKLHTNYKMSENETKLSQEVERVRTNYKETLAKLTKDLNRLTDPTHYYPIDRKENLSMCIERTTQNLSANMLDKSKNIVSEIISCINLGLKQKEKMIENRESKMSEQTEMQEVKMKNLSIKTFTYDTDGIKSTGSKGGTIADVKEQTSIDVKKEQSLDEMSFDEKENLIKNEMLNEQSESFLKKVKNRTLAKQTNEVSSSRDVKVTNQDRIINLRLYMEHRSKSGEYKPFHESIAPLEEPPQTVRKIQKPAKKEFHQTRNPRNEDRAKLKLSQKDKDFKFEEYEDVLKIDDIIRNEEKKKGGKGRKVLFSEKVVILEDKETTISPNESGQVSTSDEIKQEVPFALDDISFEVKEEEIEAICQSIASSVIRFSETETSNKPLEDSICSKLDVETFTKIESEERSVQVFASKDDITQVIASTDFTFNIEEDGRGIDEKSEVSTTNQVQSELTDEGSIIGSYDLEDNFPFSFDVESPTVACESVEHDDFLEEQNCEEMDGSSLGTIEAVFDENEQRILGEYEGQLIGEFDEATVEIEPRMYGEGDVLSVDDAEEESTFEGYDETSIEEYEERLSEGSSDVQTELSDVQSDHSNDHIQHDSVQIRSSDMQMEHSEIEPSDIQNEHGEVHMEHGDIQITPEEAHVYSDFQMKNPDVQIKLSEGLIESSEIQMESREALMNHSEGTEEGCDILAEGSDVVVEYSNMLLESSDFDIENRDVENSVVNIEADHSDLEQSEIQMECGDVQREVSDVDAELSDMDTEPSDEDAGPTDVDAEPIDVNVEPNDDVDVKPSGVDAEPSNIEIEYDPIADLREAIFNQTEAFGNINSVEAETFNFKSIEDNDLDDRMRNVDVFIEGDRSHPIEEYERMLENIIEENDQSNEVENKHSERNLNSEGTEDFEDAEIFDMEENQYDTIMSEVCGDLNCFYDAEAKMDDVKFDPLFEITQEVDRKDEVFVNVETPVVYLKEEIAPDFLLKNEYDQVEKLKVPHEEVLAMPVISETLMEEFTSKFVQQKHQNFKGDVECDELVTEDDVTQGDQFHDENDPQQMQVLNNESEGAEFIKLDGNRFYQDESSLGEELPLTDDEHGDQQIELSGSEAVTSDEQYTHVEGYSINVELPSTQFFETIENNRMQGQEEVRNIIENIFIEHIDDELNNEVANEFGNIDVSNPEENDASKSENCDVEKRVSSTDLKEADDEAKNVKSKRSFPSLGKLGKKTKKDSNCKIS